jgi:DNA-binding transcriptional LysR family regulator
MNHNHVAVFLDVVEQGSINGAARIRNVAQSAVSRIVRELEHTHGVRLLDRHTWGVEPTEAGKVLADLARAIRAEANVAETELETLKKGATAPRLRIGTGQTTAASILPRALENLALVDPSCQVYVQTTQFDLLLRSLARGELDLVLGRIGNSHLPEGLVEELLYHDAMVMLAGAHHRLARQRSVSNADLAASRWVLPPRDAEPRRDTEAVFHALGLSVPMASIESDSVELVRAILHSDEEWLALMPRDLFRLDVSGGRITIIREAPEALVRPVGLVRRRRGQGDQKHPFKTFRDILGVVAAEHLH